ncbi:hypothetical protein [Alteriqipengyuania lutimaris]|uniref:PAS domain-containing protein n=1 Tax=Alteriqipengyuania lutimaris TaxID=1538146 RepID=UPI001CFF0457|nr:hypothetical protein [Alteriqipengyuania lutimaris]
MDSLRGNPGVFDELQDDTSWEENDTDGELSVDETPPSLVGQDERRMQVRAYNYWAGLLGDRTFPSVEDIESDRLPDFSENSVLLDFTSGTEDPAIVFLGDKLAGECHCDHPIRTLADVPSRSLLSRITDHYLQILANEAPIGFEAEFVNDTGATVLYRGILLPFSSDDETIDFIYGVINWKEVADQLTTDALLLQIDQALDSGARPQSEDDDELPAPERRVTAVPSITRWADGPGSSADQSHGEETAREAARPVPNPVPSPTFARLDAHVGGGPLSPPMPGATGNDESRGSANATGLHACLAEARALVEAAGHADARSRAALYAAVSRAHDVALAAQAEPDAFAALLHEHAIEVAPRAPMTPVVKLVFGTDYDKSRIAEYAAVLAFAQREGIAHGALAAFLDAADGGLKGVVARERAFRREAAGKPAAGGAKARVRRKLATLPAQPIDAIPVDGAEFSVCVIRRDADGAIAFLGEVADDERLLARAAKHLAHATR